MDHAQLAAIILSCFIVWEASVIIRWATHHSSTPLSEDWFARWTAIGFTSAAAILLLIGLHNCYVTDWACWMSR
jgi:hypothetical protein